MTTEARIHANRLNAQKSTGPNTPQGKAVVSQNALKHGLSARRDVITTESQADFDLHRDALLAELNPQGPMESILAERIVSLSWRLKRADLIQNQTIDALHEESTAKPFPALTRLLTPENQDPDLILGRIALKDFSNERVLDRLLMYERRIEHSLFKTMLELQRLRLLRTLDHPNAAAPAPPFSRRRHACPERSRRDDALTPNSTPHARIPIHHEPIINNQSSIVNIEKPSAPPFSRRRHDDALTPNSTPHVGIPIRREPIINNQSSIVNIESPPEPGQNHPTSTVQHPPSTIEHPASSIEHQESSIIAQNKPNVKMGNINISTATTKPYLNEQRTTNNERCSKQTQSNPIPHPKSSIVNHQ